MNIFYRFYKRKTQICVYCWLKVVVTQRRLLDIGKNKTL